MLNKICFTLALLLACATATAQKRGELRFHDGEFKIVQLTDIHYKLHNPASSVALQCIEEVVKTETPDLIVITGDVVYSRPADSTLLAVTNCVSALGVPWVMLFGNHDEERGLTNAQLYDIARAMPMNIQPERDGSPSPDYVLPVLSSDGQRPAALLYCMDSHNHAQNSAVKGYAWITPQQVEWYRHMSQAAIEQYHDTLPSLAFFHIPLPEYNQAAASEGDVLIGTRMEKACAPHINTGMFAAMRLQGDVMATFCGHDHDNDYVVMHEGILLAYGRYTGGNTEYNHLRNGARVIVLKEGQRSFQSWIYLRGGQTINHVTFPNSFVKDNWRLRKQSLQ